MMSRFKRAVALVCLLVTASVAHASYTYSLTGPTSLEVGETGSFNFHVSYVPVDLAAFGTYGGWVEYTLATTYTVQFAYMNPSQDGYRFLTGGVVDSPNTFFFGTLSNYFDPASPNYFDKTMPFERDIAFSMVFDKADDFLLQVAAFNSEYVIRNPTALCYADPGCSTISEPLQDYTDFRNSTSSQLQVNVSAVPEIETLAMMLAGLGLVASIVRRRKRE